VPIGGIPPEERAVGAAKAAEPTYRPCGSVDYRLAQQRATSAPVKAPPGTPAKGPPLVRPSLPWV